MLPHMMPINIALESLYTGRILDAEEYRCFGIVNKVVPYESLMEETENLVREILKNAPIPMRFNKEVAVRSLNVSLEDRVCFGWSKITESRQPEDAKEGLVAFMESREPVWKGR
jgi:enoyl-CoA hydratase/carnithine racemase